MKNNKGITLVSLIITIIILIILAGITINITVGQDGIITKAKEAKTNTEIAAEEEQKRLNELYENMINNDITTYDPATQLASFSEFKKKVAEAITGRGVATSSGASVDTFVTNINKIGTSSNPGSGSTTKAKYKTPYIPNNYEYVEGTWNTGYVIKEKTTGDEFVWVPCVTDQSQVAQGDTVVTLKEITTGKYKGGDKARYGDEGSSSENIRTSVGKYGGFYIARYEAGLAGTTASTTTNDAIKKDLTQKPVSLPNVGVWNFISRINAITVAESMVNTEDGVRSALISGEAWDTTLAWMTLLGDSDYAENSLNKGWYTNNSGGKPHTTGYYSVNNIFDMAGNVLEWTTDNYYDSTAKASRANCRGGYYSSAGATYPAANRTYVYADTSTAAQRGFRVVLYKL